MSATERPNESPFDAAAPSYDARFSHTRLGRLLRSRVHRNLESCFHQGDRVLELGCGTGEDALWLGRRGIDVLASDRSSAMLEIARHKIEQAGLEHRVRVASIDASRGEEIELAAGHQPFDGVYAGFGVLNCVADRNALAKALARVVRPGGRAAFVMMSPFCLWETGWQLLHASPRRAARRWRDGRRARLEGGASLDVWYPTAHRLAIDLGAFFSELEVRAIGVALPPSDLAALVERSPRMLSFFEACDRTICRLPGAARLADHYLLTLERTCSPAPREKSARSAATLESLAGAPQ